MANDVNSMNELICKFREVNPFKEVRIIHRPKRRLYYLDKISAKDISNFYRGILPKAIQEYSGQFGSYDLIGLFTLSDGRDVIGLELRPDDSRINYPSRLPFIDLGETDLLYCDLSFDCIPTTEVIQFGYKQARHMFESSGFGTIRINPNHYLYVIHYEGKHPRILIPIIDQTQKFRLTLDYQSMTKEDLLSFAIHDPGMEPFNWTYMFERLDTFAEDGISDYAYAYFDIKSFKMYKVTFGAEAAINHLGRIGRLIEETDWIYTGGRCDNDNFVIMIKDMPREDLRNHLMQFFEELSHVKEDPFYRLYYRCGVVEMRTALNTHWGVTDYAKVAHKMCGTLNETEICFYTDEMWEQDLWGQKIRTYLPTAIDNDEFVVYFQPKYSLKDTKIIGAEALVRWNYHNEEFLMPGSFIPSLEADTAICKLDEMVLHKVCQHLRDWSDQKLPIVPISVNLSRKQMEMPNLVSHLEKIVDIYNIDHKLIEFELTESAAYENQEYMLSVLRDLKAKGFLISMDDFGNGLSSLSLLVKMPLDTLKIDKSFVDQLDAKNKDPRSIIVLQHIINMAKDLNIKCLAEGAEEKSQITQLRSMDCDFAQGYYFSKPIPVADFEKLLKKNH